MVKGTTLLGQFQALLPHSLFQQQVAASQADRKVQKATCWSHFQVMLIGLLSARSSLRDLSCHLEDRMKQLRHLRIGSVDRSTLSYANRHRPAEVLQPVLQALLQRYDHVALTLPQPLIHRFVRLDSTVIRVSQVLSPWARWAKDRAGVRLHLGLEGAALIPSFVRITSGKISERAVAWECRYEPGTMLCFDRGYFNPSWFTAIAKQGCVFLTRWKSDTSCKVLRKLKLDQAGPVIADEIIRFSGPESGAHCSLELRRIIYANPQTEKTLIFLTNQLDWPALIIAELYRSRWQIETFFRWLKHSLKLKRLWSACENGIRWQITSALILYLLLKLLRLACKNGWSLLTLMRKIASRMLEPIHLSTALNLTKDPPIPTTYLCSTYG